MAEVGVGVGLGLEGGNTLAPYASWRWRSSRPGRDSVGRARVGKGRKLRPSGLGTWGT